MASQTELSIKLVKETQAAFATHDKHVAMLKERIKELEADLDRALAILKEKTKHDSQRALKEVKYQLSEMVDRMADEVAHRERLEYELRGLKLNYEDSRKSNKKLRTEVAELRKSQGGS